MSDRVRAGVAVALVVALLAAGLVGLASRASAGAAIVFAEDFESGTIDPRWSVVDTDNASGADYWGASSYRAHGGAYSAWAAQVGTQSSGTYAGRNNSDPGVQLYDDNMQADLVIDLRVDGYVSLTLSFFYFAKTESGGGDWIQAWYEAGGNQTIIFNPRGSTGNSWYNVTLSVPNNIERLIIRFHSDAANHGFEGAYVDDIVLTGTEDVPPTSSVSALGIYGSGDPFPVPFTALDNANASGVAYVELWYRFGGSGNYTLYVRPANPLGRWTLSPVPFVSSGANGDGFYEFYTVAVDAAGNAEAPPGSPDASVTIDTTAPSLTITSPAPGSILAPGTAQVSWNGADGLSGIERYEVSVDGAGFASVGMSTSWDGTGLTPGSHTVVVRAVDRAGNVRDATVLFTVGDLGGPAGFPWWIVGLILALLVGSLVFFLWWRRRKEKEPTRGTPRSDATGRAPEAHPAPPEAPPEELPETRPDQ